MPNFESPISNKKFQGQPMRDLEVPDESGQASPVPMGGGQFSPSISRRYGTPMTEQEIRDFQARMEAANNPDMGLSDIEREVKQQRQDKIHGQNHLNEGARKRIEMLIGMTRSTRTFEIDTNTYVLQTLKGKEMREAILAASEFDGTVQGPFEIRKQFLARSLVYVAGVSIEQFVGSNTFQARLDFIDEMDDTLLNRLMDEYSMLVKEAKEKYAMRTPEQVAEVSEDIKK